VAKSFLAVLVVLLAAVCAGAQNSQPASELPGLNRPAAFLGSTLACSQSQTLQVPPTVAARARLKARLITLLRESLFDDTKGIVNIAREKEIKKLASKLKSGN